MAKRSGLLPSVVRPRITGTVLSVAALPLPLSRRVLAAPDTVFS